MKRITKLAFGLGAACLAAGEIMYERYLNYDVIKLINSHSKNDFDYLTSSPLFKEGCEWFDEMATGDTEIYSPYLKRPIYSVIIPNKNENKCNKWAFIVHGYTADVKSMSHYAKVYYEKGYNILMPHMVAHTPDKAKYISMGYYDRYMLLDWIEYILTLYPDDEIILHGVSMGAATVMLTSGESLPENVKTVIADCGYSSCYEEYASQMKIMRIPTEPLLSAANLVSKVRGNFDFKECSPLNAVIFSKTPTLFIHGEDDTFVPFEMMERLYEACSAPKKEMLPIPKAVHANAVYVNPDLYWKKVFEFID